MTPYKNAKLYCNMITVYTIQNKSTIIVSNIVSNDRQLLNYVCYIKFKDKGSMMSNEKRYGRNSPWDIYHYIDWIITYEIFIFRISWKENDCPNIHKLDECFKTILHVHCWEIYNWLKLIVRLFNNIFITYIIWLIELSILYLRL